MEPEQKKDDKDNADIYRVKRIRFRGHVVPIICQNVNGPCPLIALCNILLLRGAISIHPDYASVDFHYLSNVVANYLVEANVLGQNNINVQYNVNDVISFMPSLQFGLDVNVKFNSIVDFEFTQNQLVFDLLNVRLVHGWMIDPQDKITADIIGSRSYNSLVEHIIKMKDVEECRRKLQEEEKEEDPEEKEANDKCIHEGLVIEAFLNQSAGQLTYHGLHSLHEGLKEEELCVLFRNNHFSTLLRHQEELFVLITDVGYAGAQVVWEKLCEIDGDNVFVDSDFLVPRPPPPAAQTDFSTLDEQEAADRLMALQIQQEEQRMAAPPPGTAVVDGGFRISEAQLRQQQQILNDIEKQRLTPPKRAPIPQGNTGQPGLPLPPQRLGYAQNQPPQAQSQKNKKCLIM